MYIFKDDHLILDNQLVCFLWSTLPSLLVHYLFNTCFYSHVHRSLWAQHLTSLGDIISQQTPLSSCFYNLSTSSSTMFPEPQVQECSIDVSIGTGFNTLNFDWFWISVMVSVAKQRLIYQGVTTTLVCGYKDTCLQIFAREDADLVKWWLQIIL